MPTLTYLSYTNPTTFPAVAGQGETPGPLAAMAPVSTAIRWLGGLALFGVVGVFLKQLVAPSDEASVHEDTQQPRQGGQS